MGVERVTYVKERCPLGWRIRPAGITHPQLLTIHCR